MNITIAEVMAAKKECEMKIADAIRTFTADTGLKIEHINYSFIAETWMNNPPGRGVQFELNIDVML